MTEEKDPFGLGKLPSFHGKPEAAQFGLMMALQIALAHVLAALPDHRQIIDKSIEGADLFEAGRHAGEPLALVASAAYRKTIDDMAAIAEDVRRRQEKKDQPPDAAT